MVMNFICEMVPANYLTPLRRSLAKELSETGMKQADIGKVLGVSQPVVSSYLSSSLTSPSTILDKPAFKELVSRLLKRILEEEISDISLMVEICQECQYLRTAGPLCEVHRRNSNLSFPPDCSICFPSEQDRQIFDEKLSVTKDLYQAAQHLIESGERFAQLIPEIGCQFVSIIENAHEQTNVSDIAGFPGRIVKVKDKGQIVSYPEFGQGSTLAQILKYFFSNGSRYRSLISIKRTDSILDAVSEKKEIVTTDEADKNWMKTLRGFSSERIQEIDIIADAGGYGLEPLIYLFGKTPMHIADFLLSKF
jgi:predicted fused transcriptional regulator/phosphomethylpyrimidine kinase/predicted transcriptional regulator